MLQSPQQTLGKSTMNRERLVSLSAGLMLSVVCAGSATANATPDYGKLPLGFEANIGQADGQVKFLAHGRGYTVFLTGNAAVLSLPNAAAAARTAGSVMRMNLEGANRSAAVTGADDLPGKSNYFTGNDPGKWRTNVANYAKVKYADIYPGVDLVYYGNRNGQLEYDFVVAPHADPNAIRLTVTADSVASAKSKHRPGLRIAADGDLVVKIGGGEIRFNKPVVYQITGDTQRIMTQGRFVLTASHQVRFALGTYDHSKALIIDPSLVYSTYLGGSNYDQGFGIAVDSAGSAYVAGYAGSNDFPTVNPVPNMPTFGAFVTKFNPAGSALVYSTYLGGTGPSQANAIAVDSNGSAYVTGDTHATDFPTVNPVQPTNTFNNQDAFVSKLSPDGSSLIYSTYLGGNTPVGGGQTAWSIAIDSTGNAYVTGNTADTDFPTVNPLQAMNKTSAGSGTGFVAKYNAAGSALIYSTYLGGSDQDTPWGIAADSNGNAYVTGETNSADFPTANPIQSACNDCPAVDNAFVTKINATGTAFIYSTFLGGRGENVSYAIAVDASGNAYVTGTTTAPDFPTVNPLQATNLGSGDAFITKINPSGSALVYSTYLGGSTGADVGRGIAVDSSGNVYVAGSTDSTDFPTVNPVQATRIGAAGPDTGFVLNLNAAGSALVYSTYLGGSMQERAQAIAVDSSGSAYVTGYTYSLNFPTANPFQAANKGNVNAFVTKLPAGAAASPPPTITITAAPTTITVGQNSTLTWSSTNATSCTASGAWTGTQATSGAQSVSPAATGTSTYTLTCNGSGGSIDASATVTVNAAAPAAAPTVILSINPTSITLGQTATLTWSSTNATACTASGSWSGTQATSGTLIVTPTAAGTPSYTLSCSGSGSTSAMSVVSETVNAPLTTVTVLSGKAGGGSLGLWSVLGLGLLVAWRLRQVWRSGIATLGVILVLAMLAPTAPVSAQQASSPVQFNWDQTYVGIRAGRSTYWESSGQLDADLANYGETGTSTSINQHRTTGVVYAGVPIFKALSLELGFADLGEYRVGISTTSTNIPQLSQTIIRNLSSAGQAVTLNLAAPLDINSWFAIEPRIGLLGFRSKQEVFTPLGTFAHDREGGGIDAGLALLLRPTSRIYVGAGVDCFDTGGNRCDVLLYSAELEYHFGR
jgi:Beta-propeller repeat/OmpA-like transmembrane domain